MTNEIPERKIVILDFGNKKRKKIKRLRKGKGPLMESVKEAVQEIEQAGTLPAGSPVVVVVVKQSRKRGMFSRW